MKYCEIIEDATSDHLAYEEANRVWQQVLSHGGKSLSMDDLIITFQPGVRSYLRKLGTSYAIVIGGENKPSSKSDFIHEYTHYRDMKRGAKNKDLTSYVQHKKDSDAGKNYAENDLEYNAIYGQFIDEMMSRNSTQDLSYWVQKPFPYFMDEMLLRFASPLLRNLSLPWKKKLTKRMYGFWKWLQDKDDVKAEIERDREELRQMLTDLDD